AVVPKLLMNVRREKDSVWGEAFIRNRVCLPSRNPARSNSRPTHPDERTGYSNLAAQGSNTPSRQRRRVQAYLSQDGQNRSAVGPHQSQDCSYWFWAVSVTPKRATNTLRLPKSLQVNLRSGSFTQESWFSATQNSDVDVLGSYQSDSPHTRFWQSPSTTARS